MTKEERFYKDVRCVMPCCPNCEHFSTSVISKTVYLIEGEREYCVKDPEKRLPPAKIIAFGCPIFSQDIPF